MTEFLPIKPEGDEKWRDVPVNDRDCMNYYVAFNTTCEIAFKRFFPMYLGIDGNLTQAGKESCKQFFAYKKHKDYIEAYKRTLTKLIKKGKEVQSGIEVSGTRKERVMKKFANDVATSVETNTNTDAEILKDQADLLKKVGYLKEDEIKIEAPRRYLPVRCSECAYKIFIDEQVKLGNIKKDDETVKEQR
nr:MAG TPA: hypothetical protein [Bacteriophage sp.]